jgi:protein-S-isoprenylcysteine O-methyltransferase Ste14
MLLAVRVMLVAGFAADFVLRRRFTIPHPNRAAGARAQDAPRRRSTIRLLTVAAGAIYYLGVVTFAAAPCLFDFAQLRMLTATSAGGMLLRAGGLALSGWSRLTLGSAFSRAIEPVRGEPLVRRGPYARVRHPLYLAHLVMSAGVALMTANLVHAGVWVILAAVLLPRAVMEDRALARAFGDAWREYARRTGLLWPWRQ